VKAAVNIHIQNMKEVTENNKKRTQKRETRTRWVRRMGRGRDIGRQKYRRGSSRMSRKAKCVFLSVGHHCSSLRYTTGGDVLQTQFVATVLKSTEPEVAHFAGATERRYHARQDIR
jgi:hypothetical protein